MWKLRNAYKLLVWKCEEKWPVFIKHVNHTDVHPKYNEVNIRSVNSEVSLSDCNIWSLIESMPRQTRSMIEAQRFWTSYYIFCQISFLKILKIVVHMTNSHPVGCLHLCSHCKRSLTEVWLSWMCMGQCWRIPYLTLHPAFTCKFLYTVKPCPLEDHIINKNP